MGRWRSCPKEVTLMEPSPKADAEKRGISRQQSKTVKWPHRFNSSNNRHFWTRSEGYGDGDSTSCLWQGAHATGERQTEGRVQSTFMSVPPPSLITSPRGREWLPIMEVGVQSYSLGQGPWLGAERVLNSRPAACGSPKPLLQNVDVALRAASS